MNREQQQQQLLPPVVLDIQCFKDNNNEYIVKEVCVLDITTNTILLHHIVKPPCDRDFLSAAKQRETYWLTKHCHGLEWDQGDIKYYTLIDKLRVCLHNRSIIYVKGLQKKRYVLKYLVTNTNSTVNVIDVFEIGCQSLNTVFNTTDNQIRCIKHKTVRHKCALSNCTLLKAWIKNYFQEEEEEEEQQEKQKEEQPVHSTVCVLL